MTKNFHIITEQIDNHTLKSGYTTSDSLWSKTGKLLFRTAALKMKWTISLTGFEKGVKVKIAKKLDF